MIAVKAIEYNTFKSTDFNLLVDVAFDSDEGESDSFLDRDAISTESYNGKFRRVHGYKYTNVFSPKFTFIKNDFSDIELSEQRAILAWLTSKSTPSYLTVYNDDGSSIRFECLGAFIEVKPYKLANNRTVGFVAVFESIFPWAVSQLNSYDLVRHKKDISISTEKITIQSDDLESPVYPRVTITQDSNSLIVALDHALIYEDEPLPNTIYSYYNENDKTTTYYWTDENNTKIVSSKTPPSSLEMTSVQLINENGGKRYITTIINNIKGETVVLDGANKIVSSSRYNGRVFGSDFTWNWLPLFNGVNNITAIGNCTVKLEFREPMKIGEW